MSWTNYDRGKPCRWIHEVKLTSDERQTIKHEFIKQSYWGVAKEAEITKAVILAEKELAEKLADKSDGIYLVRTPVEVIREASFESDELTAVIRFRIRWVPDQATADKYAQFNQSFNLEAAKYGYGA